MKIRVAPIANEWATIRLINRLYLKMWCGKETRIWALTLRRSLSTLLCIAIATSVSFEYTAPQAMISSKSTARFTVLLIIEATLTI
jgi:hypothetical protein